MDNRGIATRVLAMTGLAAIIACGDACPCVDYDYEFCEECAEQGKTAYECNYDAIGWVIDITGAVQYVQQSLRLTGCYDDIADH